MLRSSHPHRKPLMYAAKPLFSYRKYWAARFGTAPLLPMSRAEMDVLGWDACDIIVVTGDAYVDHPSFGMAIIGRLLEAQGFRVGILAQPDWHDKRDFQRLGAPRLFFGVTAGNMDSMVNRYTADRKRRSDDAYTPDSAPDRRPDRAVVSYAQRCREAYPEVPVILGGIEASLRRIAHFDYWSETVRRSVIFDAKADLLVFGNGERAIVAIAHRLAAGEPVTALTDIRGTAFIRKELPAEAVILDATTPDSTAKPEPPVNPYAMTQTPACADTAQAAAPSGQVSVSLALLQPRQRTPVPTVLRLPAFEQVRDDPITYAHASRLLHLETNPGNARPLVQRHGNRELWLNPPPIPLTTAEMDAIYELAYTRCPHPSYGAAPIPAYDMIRFSVTIMRGCFGGCTFCSITEHEGRIIQNRSEDSVIREIEAMRDTTPGFTGVVSDLGGPTANMYRLACKSTDIESKCRRLSCVYPDICSNLNTDHTPLIKLYRRARALPGVKKILVASGLRYDLAVRSPEYVKELVTHHVGGYLKIAPEHTETGPLAQMMKPGIGAYEQFKTLFEKFSQEAGKKQYLIPYFIAAHPGTTTEDMLNLALWLKRNGFRADQVQTFLPSPMALATAMYHSGKNPLRKVSTDSTPVFIPKGLKLRRLHKAFLRYHDPKNWALLRQALQELGRADLIGPGKRQLIPHWQPVEAQADNAPQAANPRKTPAKGQFITQHTGLPPLPKGATRRAPQKR